MLASPTTPNLTDYVSFLYGVVGIPEENLPSAVGTATAGDVNLLIDSSANWNAGQWQGFNLVDLVQGTTQIADNDSQSLSLSPPLSSQVQPGDAYVIAPDVILTTLAIAQEIVNDVLNLASARIYTLAVYNLATDRLINYAPDLQGQTYFKDLRKMFRLTEVSVGVPSAANDQGTAVGILNPEQFKLLTLQDLQTLKTSYGRQYMAFAQMAGRTIWGLS